jgi:hypothetical protein
LRARLARSDIDRVEVLRRSGQRALYVELSVFGCLFGRLPVLTRDNIGGVPARPVVLRSGRFVLAVVHLSLLQEVGQRRDTKLPNPRPGSRLVTS